MLQAFTQKLFSYLPGAWVFRSGSADTPGFPGVLGDGGICFINPIRGGTATIQAITGGKVRIHESEH